VRHCTFLDDITLSRMMSLEPLLFRSLIAMLGWLPFLPMAFADDPLAAKTLIVYATNSPDSVAVKDHYIQARFSQPSSANVCGITPPDPNAALLTETDYVNSFKTPIRNCLNTAGKTTILYIVLAYIRPYVINLNRAYGYYAMDSYLADIWDQYSTLDFNPVPTATHRYYADVQNQGNLYVPFVAFDTFRSQPRSLLFYSVWRLDGATPAIAMGLVDKATQTMNNASGAACIDRNRGDMNFVLDAGYGAGDWDLHQAGVFLGQAGFAVTEDPNYDEFGSGAAPAKCPITGDPVGFFSGWYSLDNYNGASVFNWAPGAIGFHLDSLSAHDPRGGTNWSANALLNGITVTAGAVGEPYLEGLPRPAGVYRNLLEGANVGDAFLRNTRWIKWMIVNIGDPLYRPFAAGGKAPFNPPQPLASFAIANRFLAGGASTAGTVTLAAAAPQGGASVALSTSAPSQVSVPTSVTVNAGSQSASFSIGTQAVTVGVSPTLTANFGSGNTLSNTVTLFPLLSGVGFSQSRVSAGQIIAGAVFLTASAPAGGITIGLSSTDTTVATVPATVFVPAGLGRADFTINTSIVQMSKTTTIQASYAGATTSADLTAVPAIVNVDFSPSTVMHGQSTLFEVGLAVAAPPGGVTVMLTNMNPGTATLSGSSIFIPAGATYGNIGVTAGSSPGTATVEASYGGDAKSAVLTVN
jgi:uncharacterized protein (TIGR03790 family)